MDTARKRKRRELIYQKSNGECFYCGHLIPPKEATIDHLIPKSRGGRLTLDNIVLACRHCNSIKAQIEDIDEAIQKIRFYNLFGKKKRWNKSLRKIPGLKSLDKKVQSEQDEDVL